VTNCETCGSTEPIGVCCVPGVPYSAAYCGKCFAEDASPFGILRANISCCLSTKAFDDFGEFPWEGGQVIAEWALEERTYLDGRYMTMKEALRIKPITRIEIEEFDRMCSEHDFKAEMDEE